MGNILWNWAKKRLGESSTYIGLISAVAGMFGLHLSTNTIMGAAGLAATVVGGILMGATTKSDVVNTVLTDVEQAIPVARDINNDLKQQQPPKQ